MAAWQGLGDQLRRQRERLHLTRAALARRAGLSPVYIKKLEAGEREPSLATLEQLAQGLGLTVQIRLVQSRRTNRQRRS